jgi:LCP family protein required for cell wall assembly
MKPQEEDSSPESAGSRTPNRLDWLLVALAVLLIVIVAALAASGLMGHSSEETTVLATDPIEPTVTTQPAPSPTAVVVMPSPVPVTPPPCVPPGDWVIHAVQAGDTLYSLAEHYDTDVETLKRVNCLDNDLISVDEELYVPGPPGVTPSGAVQLVSAADVQANQPSRYLNVVLLGSDRRQGSGTWRTDTIIVVSVDSERNVVRLLSIPRDLWVNIPGHGYDRINTADLWGELAGQGAGPELVKETIYQNLGIPIQYYVRVDFAGFMRIIDAVGGVDVDVECPLPDIELLPGLYHMDGEDALLYARSRITTNDFDRARRQRKLLMALWEQGLSLRLIPKLPALWVAMGGAFQTDIPLDQVMGLAYVGLQLKPSQIFSQSIGPWQVEDWVTPEGAAVLLPVNDEIRKLLESFYGPIDMDFLARISATRVQVQNGSPRLEADQLAASALGWAGLQAAGTGAADRQDYPATQIIVYNAGQDIAELIAQQLNAPPSAILMQPDPSQPVDIRVILGADYDPCSAG